jgi:hypothetical protein
MKTQSAVFAITGFLSIFSSVTFADSSVSESGLLKAIHDRVEKMHATDAKKYDRVLELAGDRRNELSAKKDQVAKAYDEWHELKSAANLSVNGDAAKFKAIEAAAEKHAQASKAFMDLQNDILAKNNVLPGGAVLAESINDANTAKPSAARHELPK